MYTVTPIATAFCVAWIVASLLAAVVLLRRRDSGRLLPEHGYRLGALLLLALAPATFLLTSWLSGSAMYFGSVVQLVMAAALFAVAARTRKERLSPGSTASSMRFAEKSALLVLIAVVALFAQYFFRTWDSEAAVAIASLVGTVIMLVVVLIVGHIGIALFHSPTSELDDTPDERDREIVQRSMRNAYIALSIAFWSMPVLILLPLPTREVLQYWFLFLVLSEVVYQGSIVRYYRAGTV